MDIKDRLNNKNLTKADMARHFKVHWNTVNNWCNNPKNLKISLAEEINKYLE